MVNNKETKYITMALMTFSFFLAIPAINKMHFCMHPNKVMGSEKTDNAFKKAL